MAAAILFFVYNLLFSGSSGSKNRPSGQEQTPVTEFVMDLIKRIREADTTAADRLIMEKSAVKWMKDPFAVIKKAEASEKGTEKEEKIITRDDLAGAFSYSGYMEMGKSRLAIINGIEYQEGDTLDIKGAFLKKISPAEVLISVGGEQEVILVPIENSDR